MLQANIQEVNQGFHVTISEGIASNQEDTYTFFFLIWVLFLNSLKISYQSLSLSKTAKGNMNSKQAFDLAIRSLETCREKYRIEAAIAEKAGAVKTAAAITHNKIEQINLAIHILKCELEARTFFDYPSRVNHEIDR